MDPRSIFEVPDTYQPREGGWVRLSKGLYKGDIAFITGVRPSLQINVIVVPRVIYEPSHKKQVAITVAPEDLEEDSTFAWQYDPDPELLKRWGPDRPLQSLFRPDLAKRGYPRACKPINRICLFKGVFYDQDGYTILKELDTDWYTPEDAVPTAEEYSRFSASTDIPADVRRKTIERITSMSFHTNDAVKVIDGESRGLFGRIVALRENEADLFLPLQGSTSTIPLTSLRKDLRIGDEVRVESGPDKGFTGWVVNKDEEFVWLFNHQTGTEVSLYFRVPHATDACT